MQNKFCGILFSKDRALQVEATINSFFNHCKDYSSHLTKLNVLYTYSSEDHKNSYDSLISQLNSVSYIGPYINWIKETNFRADLISTLEEGKNSTGHVLFLVDDTIFIRDFLTRECLSVINDNNDVLGFSLRLGKNTKYCYFYNILNKIPDMARYIITNIDIINDYDDNSLYTFKYMEGGIDYSCHMEVSSSIYRIDVVLDICKVINFSGPNNLEMALVTPGRNIVIGKGLIKIACYSLGRAFSTPINLVQNQFVSNRIGSNKKYSSSELLDKYREGLHIDIEKYNNYNNIGVHEEIELYFTKEIVYNRSERWLHFYPNSTFITTVGYIGDIIQDAINSDFKKIICLEPIPELADICKERFKNNIDISFDRLNHKSFDSKDSITFWLDGFHCDYNFIISEITNRNNSKDVIMIGNKDLLPKDFIERITLTLTCKNIIYHDKIIVLK